MINFWQNNGLLDDAFLAEHATGSEVLLKAAAEWSIERASSVCRIPAELIETLARKYAAAQNPGLRCGWGLERNLNGASAVAAVLAMPTMLGKFGKRGSGFMLSNSSAFSFDAESVLGSMKSDARLINMTQLASVLNEPEGTPVKALFVYNNNPVATSPDQNRILQGLAREDLFTVVHEQVMTDTAVWADILLPATTFMEHFDIRKGYGSMVVGGTHPIIEPVGESRCNGDVFSMLGKAMGFDDEPFDWDMETHFMKVAEKLRANGEPVDVSVLKAGGQVEPVFKEGIQFVAVMPDGGKINLGLSAWGDQPYRWSPVESDEYPLALISPANPKLVTSTFGEFNLPTLTVTMNPTDAGKRSINHGDSVRVFNELGEVLCPVVVSEHIAPGSALMPKGAWRKSSQNGKTSVALCPEHLEPYSGGACFHDARVEIEAC